MRDRKRDKVPYIVDGTERCGAKTRAGGRCKNHLPNGTHRCKKHGGAAALALMGSGNPNYKHGRYMRYPKSGFVDRIEYLMNDENLRSLNSEIALVTTRIEDLLETAGNPGVLWDDAKRHYIDNRIDDPELWRIIEGGIKMNEAWAEIYTAVEIRRKLSDSAHRQEMQTGLMLSAAEWASGAGQLLEATRNVVRIIVESAGQYDYDSAMLLVADEFDARLGDKTIGIADAE